MYNTNTSSVLGASAVGAGAAGFILNSWQGALTCCFGILILGAIIIFFTRKRRQTEKETNQNV